MRCLACKYKKAAVRGRCWKCYMRVYKMVKRKEITWTQVEKLSLLSPKLPPGRKRITVEELSG